MIGCYLQAGEEEDAAKCFETYMENIVNAETCLKDSVFFGDLGDDIRFVSNGTLVSLQEFREEMCKAIQNPWYRNQLGGNEKYEQGMEKLKLYMEGK